MKRWFFLTVFLAVGVALLIAAVGTAWYATTHLPQSRGLARAAYIAADVLLGVALLLAAVLLSVRLAVRFFAQEPQPPS